MRPVITHVGLLTRPRMGNSTSTSPTSFPYHTSSGQSRRRTTRHMSPQRAGGGGANEPEKSNAKECKERGNKLYQAQRFDEAVQAYTAAIMRDNTDPTYFTNRALCYVQQKKWAQTEQDCRRALELDSKNVKANYLLGKACVYFQRYDEAIKVLTRANENALTQKLSYGDDITYVLRQALRERFRIEEDKRISQEIELQSYLNDLIDKDIERKISDVKEKSNDELVVAKTEEDARHFGAASKELLNNLFAQIDDRRRRREIPDYLCGKISFELLKDPVITPSGITYDRADIKEHIHRVGHFDPITRVPLNVEQLIPNLAMKEVLDTFITENQWALDA